MQSPKSSPRGKLLTQYVRARITDLKGIDLSLFEFDRHNALYYFVLNSQEEIYLRYGGRDANSASTYLNSDSFDLALQEGLKKHLTKPKTDKSKSRTSFFPRDIKGLNQQIILQNRCVECHLVADYQAQEMEQTGSLFKPRDLYLSPDIKTLGIHLDIPRGLIVGKPTGQASKGGLLAGDKITHLNKIPLITFADLQHQLNKVERTASQVSLGIDRGKTQQSLLISLPREWWVTDLTHRHWSMEPQLYFQATPLTDTEKIQLNLPLEGFASRVRRVDIEAILNESHTLEAGDIIVSAGDQDTDKLTQNAAIHLKLRLKAGESTTLNILRDKKKMQLKLKSGRLEFRK